MISQLFKVATEFRFEIGSAMFSAQALQNQVQGISDAASEAELSFKRMAMGAAVNMGLGSGSLLGILQQAIKTSDKFTASQIQLSTIFAANQDKLTGPVDDFNARLSVSEQILKRIAKISQEYSLDEGAFADTVKGLGAVLTNKGLAGTNMSNAIELGRGFLKSSPILGIDPNEAQGQLIRSLEGGAGMGDTLFRRLTSETSAMAEFSSDKGGSKKFNALPAAQRLERLTKALNQFASSNKELDAQANTLSNRMRGLQNTFTGLNGILKPLGDVVLPNIVAMIKQFTEIADTQLRVAFENVAKLIKPFADDLEGLAVNILQIQKLQRDSQRAATGLGVLGIASLVAQFIGFGRVLKFVGVLLKPVMVGLGFLVSKIGYLGIVFKALGFVVSKLFLPFAMLLTFFQIISRAQAIAKLRDLAAIPKIMAVFSGLLERASKAIQVIIGPFMEVVDFFAELLAPMFQTSFYLQLLAPLMEGFVVMLEGIAKVVMLARAGLEGVFFAIFQFVENLMALKFTNLGEGVGTAFNAGVDSILEKYASKLGGDDAPVTTNFVNIGKVEIKNQFKENAEPDRIAFSLTEQLMKVAQNPTQALNRGGLMRTANAGGGGR
jgi:hypothetical protein